MQDYLVTVSDLELFDVPIRARSSQHAALKVLKQNHELALTLLTCDAFEVIAESMSGKQYIYMMRADLSFQFERVG